MFLFVRMVLILFPSILSVSAFGSAPCSQLIKLTWSTLFQLTCSPFVDRLHSGPNDGSAHHYFSSSLTSPYYVHHSFTKKKSTEQPDLCIHRLPSLIIGSSSQGLCILFLCPMIPTRNNCTWNWSMHRRNSRISSPLDSKLHLDLLWLHCPLARVAICNLLLVPSSHVGTNKIRFLLLLCKCRQFPSFPRYDLIYSLYLS